ncbi:hypothetical protein [Pseudarthrobacter sp. S9]|uniref:hypothetical protein n=1 Tax=Pseudarthrobacter sp. S9 TaxID=3418421 RepID=UPI003D077F12
MFGIKPSRGFVPTGCVLFERGARVGAGEYLAGAEELQRFSQRTAGFFADINVWLTPTVGGPPDPLGTLAGTEEEPLRGREGGGPLPHLRCRVRQHHGRPAMSVPASLPLAVAFLGRPGDHARLMALAAQLEVARPLARASPCSTRARAARVFEPFSASRGFAEAVAAGPPRSRPSRSMTS